MLPNDHWVEIPRIFREDVFHEYFHAFDGCRHRTKYRKIRELAFVCVDITGIRNSVGGWSKAIYTIEGRWNTDGTLKVLNNDEGGEISRI